MIRQAFTNAQSNVLTWTVNGGVLTTPYDEYVSVFVQGQKLTTFDYSVIANSAPGQSEITINSNIHVDGNNYEVYLLD